MERKQWIHIIEWSVAIAALVYLTFRLATYEDYSSLLVGLRTMGRQQYIALTACVALMPVNMFLEAWRWHTLMGDISMREAHRQVYYSKLAGLITPWRLGEYPARGLLMARGDNTENRHQMAKVLSMGAVGSATMTLAIVIAGIVALAFSPQVLSLLGNSYLYALLAVIVILTACLALAPKALKKWAEVNNALLYTGIMQSFIRLLCWYIQLAMVLYAFGTVNSLLSTIPVYYLLVTITPNVPIVEVGVRGAWAMLLFGTANAALAGVLLWVINTLLPCIFAVGTLRKSKI